MKQDAKLDIVVKLKPKMEREEIQELQYFEYDLPSENFNFQGRKVQNVFRPDFRKLVLSHDISFAEHLSNWRLYFKQSLGLSIGLSFLTAFSIFKRHSFVNYLYLPTFTSYFTSIYSYNLSCGEMINRVNVETFNILNEEKKVYFPTIGSAKKALEEYEKEVNKNQNEK